LSEVAAYVPEQVFALVSAHLIQALLNKEYPSKHVLATLAEEHEVAPPGHATQLTPIKT